MKIIQLLSFRYNKMGEWAQISSDIKFLDVAAGGSMLPSMLLCYKVCCHSVLPPPSEWRRLDDFWTYKDGWWRELQMKDLRPLLDFMGDWKHSGGEGFMFKILEYQFIKSTILRKKIQLRRTFASNHANPFFF